MGFKKSFLKNILLADNKYTQASDVITTVLVFIFSLVVLITGNRSVVITILVFLGLRWILNIFLIRIEEITDEDKVEKKTNFLGFVISATIDFVLGRLNDFFFILSLILCCIGLLIHDYGIMIALIHPALAFFLAFLNILSKYIYFILVYSKKAYNGLRGNQEIKSN
ncbi:MAG: hypothetical protein JXR63_04020 [Spirochaetales bacterium]|nr:hypothetical protein [Spirochaetales bacterium]